MSCISPSSCQMLCTEFNTGQFLRSLSKNCQEKLKVSKVNFWSFSCCLGNNDNRKLTDSTKWLSIDFSKKITKYLNRPNSRRKLPNYHYYLEGWKRISQAVCCCVRLSTRLLGKVYLIVTSPNSSTINLISHYWQVCHVLQ